MSPSTPGPARRHDAFPSKPTGVGFDEDGLPAHWRSCCVPRSLLTELQRGLEQLHGLTAPRLVSTWLVLLLLATLTALAF